MFHSFISSCLKASHSQWTSAAAPPESHFQVKVPGIWNLLLLAGTVVQVQVQVRVRYQHLSSQTGPFAQKTALVENRHCVIMHRISYLTKGCFNSRCSTFNTSFYSIFIFFQNNR